MFHECHACVCVLIKGEMKKKILYVGECTPNDGSMVLACNKMLMQKLVY